MDLLGTAWKWKEQPDKPVLSCETSVYFKIYNDHYQNPDQLVIMIFFCLSWFELIVGASPSWSLTNYLWTCNKDNTQWIVIYGLLLIPNISVLLQIFIPCFPSSQPSFTFPQPFSFHTPFLLLSPTAPTSLSRWCSHGIVLVRSGTWAALC